MLCVACAIPASGMCAPCRRSLRRGHASTVDGVTVMSAYRHTGAAVRLVHNLKYRRCVPSGRVLVAAMLEHVPDGASCVVPVPRSIARRIRYGIDQTTTLAGLIADRRSLPIVHAFAAPAWWRRRAGMDRDRRRSVAFRVVTPVPLHAVIVDDVLTTGATIASVAALVPHREFVVVTATSAGTMEWRAATSAAPGGDVPSDRAHHDWDPIVDAHAPRWRWPAARPNPRRDRRDDRDATRGKEHG